MRLNNYLNAIFRNLGIMLVLFLIVNLIDSEIYGIGFARLLAILSVAITCYDIFVCGTSLQKTVKNLLRAFGGMLIAFIALVIYNNKINYLRTGIMFVLYALIWFGLLIAIEIIQRKHIEVINKRLRELNGGNDEQ
ncbi:MAG: hypothetical protein IJX51_03235 [Clostridia bacterium]|nr:hypothetical protein [Clostridia bacterium]